MISINYKTKFNYLFLAVSLIIKINLNAAAKIKTDISPLDLALGNGSAIDQNLLLLTKVSATRSKLDLLPSEVIGNILCQLNHQIGTKGLINKKDIEVIVKNVHNLSMVNKSLIPSIAILNIDDVADQYSQLAQLIVNQPYFDGQGGFSSGKSKVLTCDDYTDCRIFELLIKKISRESHCNITSIGGGNNQRYINGICLGYGLELNTYENSEPLSIEAIKKHFKSVIERLKIGWLKTKLIENKDILHTESEEEWYLFIKKDCAHEDDTLIRFLANKFKLKDKITCHDYWIGGKTSYRGIIYLWIKKEFFDQVKEILRFDIDLSVLPSKL